MNDELEKKDWGFQIVMITGALALSFLLNYVLENNQEPKFNRAPAVLEEQ